MTKEELKEIYERKLAEIPEKVQVTRSVTVYESELFGRPLSEVIEILTELKEKYGNFRIRQTWGLNDDIHYDLVWKEDETAEESKKRIEEYRGFLNRRYEIELKKLNKTENKDADHS